MTRVLFVCMGNICRSPTAEAVFRRAVQIARLEEAIVCDSAGTHDYHIGEPPDLRAQEAAVLRGYEMSDLRGRQICEKDFEQFDYVLAMDRHNLLALDRMCPRQHVRKLSLYCDYHEKYAGQDVPDPYYGGAQGFETVLDIIEAVSASLIVRLPQFSRS